MINETLLTFIIASALLSLAPGPDNLFVLTMSAVNGPRQGIIVTLGLCAGLVLHTLAAAIGIAAVFQTYSWAMLMLKLMGAVYLLYLAWHAFNASAINNAVSNTTDLSRVKLFQRGFIMNITNPKVSIFFLAFLPQFAVAEQGAIMLQMLLLGGIFILVALLIFSTVALSAGLLASQLRHSEKMQRYLNRMAAIVFLGLALRLIAEEIS